jgi:cytochrome P450
MAKHRYPPGPSTFAAIRGLRVIGGGNDFSEILVFLTGVVQHHGGIAHWTILGRHFFMLDDPALIEDVLVTKARDFKKGRGIQRLKRLLGEGLLASEEPLHLRRRRLLQPAFHRDRIAAYGRQMVAATLERIAAWKDGMTLAIDAEMTRLTLTIVARTLFGADLGSRTDAIRAALTTVAQTFPASLSRSSELLEVLPFLPLTRRFARARDQLDRVIYEIIAQRRGGPAAAHDDLLAMLLTARDADGGLSDVAVRDEAMTLFVAGHETTANALAWAWYLLARHPAAAARLRAELDGVLGGRIPDPDDLPRLPFARGVLAETLRLYPPAWALGRRAIRETSIADQFVPRGSVVIACPLITHRNPRYWDESEAFRPERWIGGSASGAKFAYFPFGGGNRRCIGESFAWMEGVLLLAAIAQHFELDAIDDTAVEAEPLITLRPRSPVRVRIRARERLTV